METNECPVCGGPLDRDWCQTCAKRRTIIQAGLLLTLGPLVGLSSCLGIVFGRDSSLQIPLAVLGSAACFVAPAIAVGAIWKYIARKRNSEGHP